MVKDLIEIDELKSIYITYTGNNIDDIRNFIMDFNILDLVSVDEIYKMGQKKLKLRLKTCNREIEKIVNVGDSIVRLEINNNISFIVSHLPNYKNKPKNDKALYNPIMKYNLSQHEELLANACYTAFGYWDFLEYEDEKISIMPYRESNFDYDDYEWVNIIWKPTGAKFSYIKSLCNGTLEGTDKHSIKEVVKYIYTDIFINSENAYRIKRRYENE